MNTARNEKCDQMNPSSTTLSKAGISAVPLQLQRRTPSLIVQTREIINLLIIHSEFILILYIYIYHFLETAQTNDCETFESKTWALARQCFHFQTGLNPSFMPLSEDPIGP
ncbi:Hypothetical_protein [Hexamita inflata]|uniref:Hypothetical_protein n=1 Tax=Hexamita inflata TaxID=28002 RepID=A0AA86Q370_9EUKA|nr:Hypothetical protein HINF_LOCUS32314 [Hexamita inflata]CAI9944671.1 Hypothetical protein HINF_LOCUS32316 [Hexamita inflata]CAI9944674.1 Hypothetical protein HINF_LOCUS32319 [Hexamita inflata]